ncbi:MAG: LCP family protein [Clostridia bacterium]|nr:LCP family protein [Clostridia bacterium]
MDNKPEKEIEASAETKQPKPKMPKKKKVIITLCIVFGVLLALVAAAVIGINYYIDHMLDYISYDTGEEEWSGENIDDPSWGIDEDISYDLDFSDPEEEWDESVGDVSFPSSDVSDEISDDSSTEGSEDVSDETSDEASGDSSVGETSKKPDTSKDDSSGETSKKPTQKPFEPDDTILSGLFDDSEINYDYDSEVINVLLIGADTFNKGTGRSDTMIIMSINTTKKRIVFSSLMRDLYVRIPGYKDNRLNAAHSAGGPKLLMKTIKENFGIQVDYYARVNFSSFRLAVDSIGGIDLTINKNNYDYFKKYDELKGLTKAEAIDGTHVIHIDGTVALKYARNRNFAGSDFTRTLHQRDLLSQFVTNCKGSSLSELHELLKCVLPYVVTNMPKDMLKMMVFEAVDYVSYDIVSCRVPCSGSYKLDRKRGMSVIVFDEKKNRDYLWSKIYGD